MNYLVLRGFTCCTKEYKLFNDIHTYLISRKFQSISNTPVHLTLPQVGPLIKALWKAETNLRQIDHGMTTSIIYQHGQTFWTSVAPLRFGWNRTGLSSYVLEREYIFRLLDHWSISFLQFIVSYIVQQMVHHCSMGYVALKSQMELQ